MKHLECTPMIPPESATGKKVTFHHRQGSVIFLNTKPSSIDARSETSKINALNA